jgi:regulator of protease activity HflC (stomatin/prohibitin superfamily)
MEKQMRAERDRRAAILNAEGIKQSQILTADGDRQGAILRAQGEREARILQAEGQAKAIQTVFNAVHTANPDSKVLAYQYLQALPQIAAGQSNKVWIIPAELTKALEGIGGALGGLIPDTGGPITTDTGLPEADPSVLDQALAEAQAAAAETEREAVRGLPAAPRLTASEVLGAPTDDRERA